MTPASSKSGDEVRAGRSTVTSASAVSPALSPGAIRRGEVPHQSPAGVLRPGRDRSRPPTSRRHPSQVENAAGGKNWDDASRSFQMTRDLVRLRRVERVTVSQWRLDTKSRPRVS